MKRGFETLQNAGYLNAFSPPGVGGVREIRPRMALQPPNAAVPGPPTPMPTTSQQDKKTNVQIPYTRIVTTVQNVGEVGTPVFVFGKAMAHTRAARKLDSVMGVEAVQREYKAALKINPTDTPWDHWRLDGIMISTEREMDPDDIYLVPPRNSGGMSMLVSVQGPTLLRNLYSARPRMGDMCYVGLERISANEHKWVHFSSQHMELSNPPSVPLPHKLPITGHIKSHPLTIEFDKTSLGRMEIVYQIGRVMDVAPSPGVVQVNVQIAKLEKDQLGIRHDTKANIQVNPAQLPTVAQYNKMRRTTVPPRPVRDYVYKGTWHATPAPPPPLVVAPALSYAFRKVLRARRAARALAPPLAPVAPVAPTTPATPATPVAPVTPPLAPKSPGTPLPGLAPVVPAADDDVVVDPQELAEVVTRRIEKAKTESGLSDLCDALLVMMSNNANTVLDSAATGFATAYLNDPDWKIVATQAILESTLEPGVAGIETTVSREDFRAKVTQWSQPDGGGDVKTLAQKPFRTADGKTRRRVDDSEDVQWLDVLGQAAELLMVNMYLMQTNVATCFAKLKTLNDAHPVNTLFNEYVAVAMDIKGTIPAVVAHHKDDPSKLKELATGIGTASTLVRMWLVFKEMDNSFVGNAATVVGLGM